jgi:hypothetical protein
MRQQFIQAKSVVYLAYRMDVLIDCKSGESIS